MENKLELQRAARERAALIRTGRGYANEFRSVGHAMKTPEPVEIAVETTHRITVSKKWIFLVRAKSLKTTPVAPAGRK